MLGDDRPPLGIEEEISIGCMVGKMTERYEPMSANPTRDVFYAKVRVFSATKLHLSPNVIYLQIRFIGWRGAKVRQSC